MQQPPPATPQPQIRKRFWKRVPGWLWTAIVAFSVLVTVLAAYPWLSIHEGALTDPANPFSELFTVSNGGYIPLTDLDAYCTFTLNRNFSDNTALFQGFAAHLGHDGGVTLPCFRAVSLDNFPVRAGATLDVKIEYAFFHINLARLRRSQSFHFQNIIGKDGVPHWIVLAS